MPMLCGYSQSVGDTISIIKDAKNVKITKSPEKTRIYGEYTGEDGKESFFFYTIDNIIEKEECEDGDHTWNFSLPYYAWGGDLENENLKSKKLRNIILLADHIYAGWRFNYHDKGKLKNCFEVGIRNIVGLGWQQRERGPLFSIGLGFGINRLNSENGCIFDKERDRIFLTPMAEGKEKTHSYLDIYKIELPLMIRQPLGQCCSFSVGAALSLNFYAGASATTSNGNVTEKRVYKGLQQRFLSTDIFASFNIFGLGVYASWNPIGLFNSSFGPDAKGWSIGIDVISR